MKCWTRDWGVDVGAVWKVGFDLNIDNEIYILQIYVLVVKHIIFSKHISESILLCLEDYVNPVKH